MESALAGLVLLALLVSQCGVPVGLWQALLQGELASGQCCLRDRTSGTCRTVQVFKTQNHERFNYTTS